MNATKKKIIIIIAIILFVWIAFSINFAVIQVSGQSMEPTLNNNQLVFGRKTFKTLDRFDIVVCLDDYQMPIIKRIIGLPEETIEYKNNSLYINNVLYQDYGTGQTEDFIITLNKDEYFCMGDNREHSRDSRAIGSINKNNIIVEILS